ncbi:HigA family addiction module antitoxin [Quadrisphaera sp. GCM10027208]|uniref:HigA family addiction module antitoxin n=1 Tax=Quadrisphaera sp. GCM10027208 TaxID=3273423 RepID=UPI00360E794A
MTDRGEGTSPDTPGEVLLEEVLQPLGITQYRLAQATGLPQTRTSEIVRGKRAIMADTSLRPSRAVGVDGRFWISIQTDYDLKAERGLHGDDIGNVIPSSRDNLISRNAVAAGMCVETRGYNFTGPN